MAGQDSQWEAWFGPEIPGFIQDAGPAYAGTGLPTQCLVSVTVWFLKRFFFHAPWMILGFPRSLWRHVETQPMPRGGLKAHAGWLETGGLLWGQRQLGKVIPTTSALAGI